MRVSGVRIFGVIVILVLILSRSVDAGPPTGHYVVAAGSGTVYDTKSNLTWQQTVSSTAYTWADAKAYCAGVGTSLEGTGWRLPTIRELQSIVDSLPVRRCAGCISKRRAARDQGPGRTILGSCLAVPSKS
jgi:hypothetical protein